MGELYKHTARLATRTLFTFSGTADTEKKRKGSTDVGIATARGVPWGETPRDDHRLQQRRGNRRFGYRRKGFSADHLACALTPCGRLLYSSDCGLVVCLQLFR